MKPATQAGDFNYQQDSEDEGLPEDTMKDLDEFESRIYPKAAGHESDSD